MDEKNENKTVLKKTVHLFFSTLTYQQTTTVKTTNR